MNAVLRELDEARAATAAEAPEVVTTDFRATILGGAWTAAHAGVAADYAIGMTRTQTAEDVCRRRRLRLSSRYSLEGYGHATAHIMARAWAHRMQLALNGGRAHPYGPEMRFTLEDWESYQPPSELRRLAEGPAVTRQLRGRLGQLAQLRLHE